MPMMMEFLNLINFNHPAKILTKSKNQVRLHRGKTRLCVQGFKAHFPTDLHQTWSKLCLGIAINAPATILQYFEK